MHSRFSAVRCKLTRVDFLSVDREISTGFSYLTKEVSLIALIFMYLPFLLCGVVGKRVEKRKIYYYTTQRAGCLTFSALTAEDGLPFGCAGCSIFRMATATAAKGIGSEWKPAPRVSISGGLDALSLLEQSNHPKQEITTWLVLVLYSPLHLSILSLPYAFDCPLCLPSSRALSSRAIPVTPLKQWAEKVGG